MRGCSLLAMDRVLLHEVFPIIGKEGLAFSFTNFRAVFRVEQDSRKVLCRLNGRVPGWVVDFACICPRLG